jgi:hypothetical protein
MVLFIGALTMTLFLFKVDMLDCMGMDVVSLCWTALVGICSGWLNWTWASLVEWALWCGWVLRNGPVKSWYMSSCQSLPFTGQAYELELSFSLVRLSVSAHSQFLQGGAMCSFHHNAAESPHQHMGKFSSAFCLSHSRQGKMFPSCILPPVLSRVGMQLAPQLC